MNSRQQRELDTLARQQGYTVEYFRGIRVQRTEDYSQVSIGLALDPSQVIQERVSLPHFNGEATIQGNGCPRYQAVYHSNNGATDVWIYGFTSAAQTSKEIVCHLERLIELLRPEREVSRFLPRKKKS